MSFYENTARAQKDRHDIEPGWYSVIGINARASRDGRSVVSLSLRGLGGWCGADVYPHTQPVAVLDHDPLVDAIWALNEGPQALDTGDSSMRARAVWMVEIGPAGKPLGFTRASEVTNMGAWSSNCHLLGIESYEREFWRWEKNLI